MAQLLRRRPFLLLFAARTISHAGNAMAPVQLTTGYGEVLGRWYMTSMEEEQEGLLLDGAPRKQTFSLEFKRYGDDYQNL